MLDEPLVKSKFAEFQEKYAGQNIDDYENYILSRTIEYFYNTERQPIDKLVSLIALHLKGEEPRAPSGQAPSGEAAEPETDGFAGAPAQDTRPGKQKKTRRRKWARRALSTVVVGALALGGYKVCRSWAKKRRPFSVLRKRRR